MPNPVHPKRGFSIVEALAALTITLGALSLAMGGYLYLQKNRNQQVDQDAIDADTHLAVARLQRELRLSDLSEMVFHPPTAKKYTGISFPVPANPDAVETYPVDAEGRVAWVSTVVYHAHGSGEGMRLLRTVFSPRDNTLSTDARQAQLNRVVADGHGANAANGGNAATHCLFEQVFEWEIVPQGSFYDGYAASPGLDRHASLGSFILTPGSHTLAFEVVGKNAGSAGYRVGLDTIRLSASGLAREAEVQSVSGSPQPVVERNESGMWSGGHQLTFPAQAAGASFGMVLYNDRWEDTNFDLAGSVRDNTAVGLLDEGYSPAEFTLKLAGNTTNWSAKVQTLDGDVGDDSAVGGSACPVDNFFGGAFVRVVLRGADMVQPPVPGPQVLGDPFGHDGAGCRVAFRSSPNHPSGRDLLIQGAYIAECVPPGHPPPPPDVLPVIDEGSSVQLLFGGSPTLRLRHGAAGWSDMADFPIAWDKSYAVTFQVASQSGQNVYPYLWLDSLSNTCSFVIGQAVQSGLSSDLLARNWDALPGGVAVAGLPHVVAVEKVHTTYAASGTYTSPPIDTTLAAPQFESIHWSADRPAGTSVQIKARAGNQPDLSDASDWENLSAIPSPGALVGIPYKRYVQYQATLGSSAQGLHTPKLRNIAIQWPGETRAVDVGGVFVNGPDYGQFQATVDGQPLVSPLRVALKVKKTVRGQGGTEKTLESASSFQINPRNNRRQP